MSVPVVSQCSAIHGLYVGDPCRIGSCTDRQAAPEEFRHRRCPSVAVLPVPASERGALEVHPVLDGHVSTESPTRSILSSLIVSAWSNSHGSTAGRKGVLRGELLENVRSWRIVSSYVACSRNPQPFSMRRRLPSRIPQLLAGVSGRGCAKFSKSAALQVKVLSRPLRRSHWSPSPAGPSRSSGAGPRLLAGGLREEVIRDSDAKVDTARRVR